MRNLCSKQWKSARITPKSRSRTGNGDEVENAKSRERHSSQTIGIATCFLQPYHNLSHVLCIFYVSPLMERVLWVVWSLCTHGMGGNNMHLSQTSTLREATRMTFQLS